MDVAEELEEGDSLVGDNNIEPPSDTLEQTLLLLDYIGTQEEAVLT